MNSPTRESSVLISLAELMELEDQRVGSELAERRAAAERLSAQAHAEGQKVLTREAVERAAADSRARERELEEARQEARLAAVREAERLKVLAALSEPEPAAHRGGDREREPVTIDLTNAGGRSSGVARLRWALAASLLANLGVGGFGLMRMARLERSDFRDDARPETAPIEESEHEPEEISRNPVIRPEENQSGSPVMTSPVPPRAPPAPLGPVKPKGTPRSPTLPPRPEPESPACSEFDPMCSHLE